MFKVTQTGTVAQYLAEFEDLANRTFGLPSPFLLSCFVSGLTPEIRREVQARFAFATHHHHPYPLRPQPQTRNPFAPSLPHLPRDPLCYPLLLTLVHHRHHLLNAYPQMKLGPAANAASVSPVRRNTTEDTVVPLGFFSS